MYKIQSNAADLRKASEREWIAQASAVPSGADPDISVMVTDDVKTIFDGLDQEGEQTYFLVKDGQDYGCAILKVTLAATSRDNQWLKLLKIHLEPQLEAVKDLRNHVNLKLVMEVLAWAILKTIKFTFDNGIGKLKIYGRTDRMLIMFESLLAVDAFIEDLSSQNISGRTEGRWLVMEKQKEA